jgi:predicted phosphoribosyltransferase
MNAPFTDRRHAGQLLARKLLTYSRRDDVSVLALPRGGVPVALEVAECLEAPLDIFVVRKLGLPGHEEFAMGAVASGGIRVLNQEVIQKLRIPAAVIEAVTESEFSELHRRERVYGAGRPVRSFAGRVVIIVDDGMATGSSMEAAVAALREHNPARIVVAVPVTAVDTFARFSRIADEIVAVITPEPLSSVGEWYDSFPQLSDEDVHTLLAHAKHATSTTG